MIITMIRYQKPSGVIAHYIANINMCCRRMSERFLNSHMSASKLHNEIIIHYNSRTNKFEVCSFTSKEKHLYSKCPHCGEEIRIREFKKI